LLLTLTLQAQEEQKDSVEASLPTDVCAYYVVVTPGNTVASLFGHAAIRMSCPSAGLDYCFTIKTPEIKDEFFDILFGHLRVGLVPEETAMFRDDYVKQGRGITEYKLNLTLDEARQLWKALDDRVSRGLYWDMDYVNNGCTQVTFDALYDLMRMRDGLNVDEVIREALPIQTRRDAVLNCLNPNTWWGFILHSCYAGPLDEEVSPRRLVVVPADGAKVLEQAGLVLSREELCRSSVTPLSQQHTWFTPLMASVLLLLLCLVPSRKVDYVTLPLQFALLLLLGSLAFFSQAAGFGWNWLILALFPLTAPVGILYMLFHMGSIFCLPQLVVVAAFLVRTLYFIQRKRDYSQHIIHSKKQKDL
jgi:hypothetical protein